ncbi:Olfactory receptor 51G2 [Plecturocebus cupreus]
MALDHLEVISHPLKYTSVLTVSRAQEERLFCFVLFCVVLCCFVLLVGWFWAKSLALVFSLPVLLRQSFSCRLHEPGLLWCKCQLYLCPGGTDAGLDMSTVLILTSYSLFKYHVLHDTPWAQGAESKEHAAIKEKSPTAAVAFSGRTQSLPTHSARCNHWYCLNLLQDFGGHPPSPMSPHTMTLESLGNSSSSISSTFLLSGISGLERMHIWISIPLCFMYLVSIMGNCTILFIIKTEHSLHEPMYFFLSMLALIDLGLSLCTLPTVLGIFWVGAREISHDSCFAQLFFIHSLSFLESSVLLSMAFDRFVAICRPLHYASILTNTVIGRIGLVSLGRSVALIFPLPFMLKRFPYCGSPVLSHSYCLHQDVMKLACADIKANSIYGMFVIVSTVGIDSLLILFSYTLILRTVLSIASRAERLKAFNTCVSHICAVLLFYTPMIGLSIIHRFGKQVPHLVQVVMGFMYLLFPPVINPIVYSVKTKQIRDRVTHAFCNCV